MALNSLPSELQDIIQEGYLERSFEEPLKAKLGFRSVADREAFPNKIGETVTKTRTGLRPAATTPIAASAASALDSGMTASTASVEQYTLSVAEYGDMAQTNLVTEGVAIGSKFLLDAYQLGEQANRTIDTLARNALFGAYIGGETFATANSSTTAVLVDNASGFEAGDLVEIGANEYTVASVAFAGSNTSTLAGYGGKSGTVTFTGNVSAASGDFVRAKKAAKTVYAGGKSKASALDGDDYLTADMILEAKSEMESNNVPMIGGAYNLYIDARAARNLYNDQLFRDFHKGRSDSDDYRDGVITEMLGVRLIRTNMNGAVNGVHRSILVGKGALVEGVYTNNGYANLAKVGEDVRVTNDVAHIIRPPLDNRMQWVTQTWIYIGGFVAPTDKLTTSAVLPSASDRRLKRGIVLASR